MSAVSALSWMTFHHMQFSRVPFVPGHGPIVRSLPGWKSFRDYFEGFLREMNCSIGKYYIRNPGKLFHGLTIMRSCYRQKSSGGKSSASRNLEPSAGKCCSVEDWIYELTFSFAACPNQVKG